MGWFKKRVIEVDISSAIEESFKKIREKALVEVNSLQLEIKSIQNELEVKQRVIDEQKAKLRDQNEADIFLMCEKIKHEILNGKKEEELTLHLQSLAVMQAQQGNYSGQIRGLSGLLGGAFGGRPQK